MNKIFSSIGDAWIHALEDVMASKEESIIDDYAELLNFQISFKHDKNDVILNQNSKFNNDVQEMRKVFFTDEENIFGHSYYKIGLGPFGNNGTEDIISLLKEKKYSKRAALSYPQYAPGKIPCINLIHFMIKKKGLVVNYFSRGQDIYRKFACDAVCIAEMAEEVAFELGVDLYAITASISSAHIYDYDFEKVDLVVKQNSVKIASVQ